MSKSTVQWAQAKALELLNEFKTKGLVPQDWRFRFNQRKSSFGLCDYAERTIYLSVYYAAVATTEQVEDTIRHEIAHILAGSEAGHGPTWKRKCLITGAKPVRCGKNVEDMPSAYKGTCPVCNTIYHAQRRLKDMNLRLCSKRMCSARARRKYITWEVNYGRSAI